MKFVANPVALPMPVDMVTPLSARKGDQILWSSHNPKNKSMPYYLTANKLYMVKDVRKYSGDVECVAIFDRDDDGGDSSWTGGEYDVIVRAPIQPPPTPVFPGASIHFESMAELVKMTQHLGNSSSVATGCGTTMWSQMDKAVSQFNSKGIK